MPYVFLHHEPVTETEEGLLRFDAETGGVYVDGQQPADETKEGDQPQN